MFFPSAARAMKALDKLDIWKDLRQVGTDRDHINQVTSIICSVGEEGGDIFGSFQLTDSRDGEKVRDKCSACFVPHIHREWNEWTKERLEKHVCTVNFSPQAVKSLAEMETTGYFCGFFVQSLETVTLTDRDQNNKTPTKKIISLSAFILPCLSHTPSPLTPCWSYKSRPSEKSWSNNVLS